MNAAAKLIRPTNNQNGCIDNANSRNDTNSV